MYCTTQQIRTGVETYVQKEILPALLTSGEAALQSVAQNKAAQLMGITMPDGSINVDVARNLLAAMIPEQGLVISLPYGMSMKFTRADVDALYNMITRG